MLKQTKFRLRTHRESPAPSFSPLPSRLQATPSLGGVSSAWTGTRVLLAFLLHSAHPFPPYRSIRESFQHCPALLYSSRFFSIPFIFLFKKNFFQKINHEEDNYSGSKSQTLTADSIPTRGGSRRGHKALAHGWPEQLFIFCSVRWQP